MLRKALSPLRAAVIALATTAVVVAAQGPAQAALPSGYWSEMNPTGSCSTSCTKNIYIYTSGNNTLVGWGQFQADPEGGLPGDAIMACDELADGWGIEMRMDINPTSPWQTDRVASTRGHNSPWCTGFQTGDIAEDTLVGLRMCIVQGTQEYCTPTYNART
ncbi:hypothetical protein [Micromonospora sp. NPDC007230]|uniref:hypothetical protein n=1 Tax=Micromonospora sp. NPDC007230 TaxID=3364237 RepID=UPI003673D738